MPRQKDENIAAVMIATSVNVFILFIFMLFSYLKIKNLYILFWAS